jgi:hypothetical protein
LDIARGQSPLQGCGEYDIWADTGYASGNKFFCFHPEIDGLEALHQAYPNMTLVLITRDTDAWYQSFRRHAKGSLMYKWTNHCNATGFPLSFLSSNAIYNDYDSVRNRNQNSSSNAVPRAVEGKRVDSNIALSPGNSTPLNDDDDDESIFWKSFYEWHTRRIQEFAAIHSSVTFIHLAVEDPTMAQQLEQLTGIHPNCWGQKNKARGQGSN